MAKELVYINRQDLIDTADALRERLESTNTFKSSEFADAIREIKSGVTPEEPNITVSASGLITATANGLSATKQLTTQAATAITPTESIQTAVTSGKYTVGTITVNAIPSNYIGSSVVINKYYTNSTTPTASLGNDGDLYLMVPVSDPIEEENPIEEE